MNEKALLMTAPEKRMDGASDPADKSSELPLQYIRQRHH